ncbi:methylmalonyl Co-A mutase-associated GTPase MeaB [Candidatus Nitrospira bockiana]
MTMAEAGATGAPTAQGEVADVVDGVRAQRPRAIARLVTWLENDDPRGAAALARLPAPARGGTVVGITGYPGAGKSTLIDQLITAYRRGGKTVAVLAVDTSSPVTGGAILGDRIRMQAHAADPGVFIRSMGTRGCHGGLAAATRDAAVVLRAAGFQIVLVETIGVGQDELEIAKVAPVVVAVVAPGLGDEVQAMKAGLFEVAHIVVVNKADREGADAALRDLREWCPEVIRTAALKGEGIPELIAAIDRHGAGRSA